MFQFPDPTPQDIDEELARLKGKNTDGTQTIKILDILYGFYMTHPDQPFTLKNDDFKDIQKLIEQYQILQDRFEHTHNITYKIASLKKQFSKPNVQENLTSGHTKKTAKSLY